LLCRLNHVGDWGTQFGQLIAHITETRPDFKTSSLPVEELQALYKVLINYEEIKMCFNFFLKQEAQQRFKTDDAFKEIARGYVVKLQTGDPEVITAWKKICEVSRRGIAHRYLFCIPTKIALS